MIRIPALPLAATALFLLVSCYSPCGSSDGAGTDCDDYCMYTEYRVMRFQPYPADLSVCHLFDSIEDFEERRSATHLAYTEFLENTPLSLHWKTINKQGESIEGNIESSPHSFRIGSAEADTTADWAEPPVFTIHDSSGVYEDFVFTIDADLFFRNDFGRSKNCMGYREITPDKVCLMMRKKEMPCSVSLDPNLPCGAQSENDRSACVERCREQGLIIIRAHDGNQQSGSDSGQTLSDPSADD